MFQNSSLNDDSGTSESFNYGVKDGVRGFYTSPSRADDSFIPFSNTAFLSSYQYNGYNGHSGLMPIKDYNNKLAVNNNNTLTMLRDVNITLYCGGGYTTNSESVYLSYVINDVKTNIAGTGNSYDWCGKIITLSLKKGDTFAIDYTTGKSLQWAPVAMIVVCLCT